MKIVCISDTHGMHHNIQVPDGHVLLHAGDMSSRGLPDELVSFAEWMSKLDHEHKLVVCGNHELLVDGRCDLMTKFLAGYGIQFIHQKLITIDGFSIYGESRTPEFFDWGWMYKRGSEAKAIWDELPMSIDLLLCHGPPLGFGDKCPDIRDRTKMVKVGCEHQLEALNRVKPKYVVCGHIHESYGVYKTVWGHVINASICNGKYEPINRPIVIDTTTGEIYAT